LTPWLPQECTIDPLAPPPGSTDAIVFLDLNSVSRRHARITVEKETATIEDLGSRNGTRGNGEKIEAATELSNGDGIEVGAASLIFRCFRRLGTTQSEVSS
jgi:pSer/pThr/pTyr-binding forkhead associated (FHA) protein